MEYIGNPLPSVTSLTFLKTFEKGGSAEFVGMYDISFQCFFFSMLTLVHTWAERSSKLHF